MNLASRVKCSDYIDVGPNKKSCAMETSALTLWQSQLHQLYKGAGDTESKLESLLGLCHSQNTKSISNLETLSERPRDEALIFRLAPAGKRKTATDTFHVFFSHRPRLISQSRSKSRTALIRLRSILNRKWAVQLIHLGSKFFFATAIRPHS